MYIGRAGTSNRQFHLKEHPVIQCLKASVRLGRSRLSHTRPLANACLLRHLARESDHVSSSAYDIEIAATRVESVEVNIEPPTARFWHLIVSVARLIEESR